MSLGRVFLASVLIAMLSVIGMALASREPARNPPESKPIAQRLSPTVHVRDQVALADLAKLRAAGYRTVIGLRPDGEVREQPSSDAVRQAAERQGLTFVYIPTPRSAIPDETVDKLSKALATAEGPVLLYCRSGSRAARVWALAEAARPGGPDKAVIAQAVSDAGQKIDDLLPRIESRIAAR
jgi:uncharacterized protein (TIGR01244 family)